MIVDDIVDDKKERNLEWGWVLQLQMKGKLQKVVSVSFSVVA